MRAAMLLMTVITIFRKVEIVLLFALLASRTLPPGSAAVYDFTKEGIAYVTGIALMKQYRGI